MTETVTVTVTGSRGKAALLTFGSALMALGGVWLAVTASADARLPGVLCAVFFGLCAIIGLLSWVQPLKLTLTDQDFTYRGLFGRSLTVRWQDVEAFHVWANPAGGGQRLVAWTYRPGRAPSGALVAASRAMGAEAALPGGWRMAPETLAGRMEALRLAAAASASA